ncbi:hypothetical protein EON79_17585 [bacterium]|nr:MAG: hypothetical protein EON79_17585 [bacterium]
MRDRLAAIGALFVGTVLAFVGFHPPHIVSYAPPLSAFGVLSALILAFPGFLGPRLRYPHALVLPLVFFAFTLAVGTFWDIREGALVVSDSRVAAAQYWISPIPLAQAFFGQALCLVLFVRREKSDLPS